MGEEKSPNIFLEISEAAKRNNYRNFNYPLQCIFKRMRYDPNTNSYVYFDERRINLQENSLTNGINIKLNKISTSTRRYLLTVDITDNHGIHLESPTWLRLTQSGTIDVDNKKELNTLHVDVY